MQIQVHRAPVRAEAKLRSRGNANKGVDSRERFLSLPAMAVARAAGRDRTASIQRVFLGLLAANLVVVGAKIAIGIVGGLALGHQRRRALLGGRASTTSLSPS